MSVNTADWADLSSNTNCKYSVIAELQDDVPILAQHPENFACTVVSADGDVRLLSKSQISLLLIFFFFHHPPLNLTYS